MRKQAGGVIRLEDIHPHWYYDHTASYQNSNQTQVLDPLVIRGKGRPKGALGGHKKGTRAYSTRRLPSAFELPSSSAPAAIETTPAYQEKLYIVQSGQSTTALAVSRIKRGQIDIYKPGTVRERAYMRGISSIYETDSIVDSAIIADDLMQNETQDYIEVDIGAMELDIEEENATQDYIKVEVGNSFN